MTERYFVQLFQGETETVRARFIKYPGSTVIELSKENYDFLQSSLISQGIAEEQRRMRG
jgi:hypothetical protein